jgi:O-antigen/teichoic acid export membrane protein
MLPLRMVDWLRDRALRRVLRLGLPVVFGKGVGSLSSLVTLALLTHHLDVAAFGVVAMVRTVVLVIDQYTNFNVWQAIVRYGTTAIAERRGQDVRQVIKLGFVIDLASGLAGAAVAAGLALLTPHLFDWTQHQASMCALYGLTLVPRAAGTADGIYRICDSYRAQAISTSMAAIVVSVAVGVAVVLDAGFDGVVLSLAVGETLGHVIIGLTAVWVARQYGHGGWWSAPLRGVRARFPGVVHFLLSTNGQLTVKKTQSELDMFVVAGLLGTAPAGLFRVVKQLGTIPGRILMPFEQVLFTELSRASAEGDFAGLWRLLRRSAVLLGSGALVIWVITALAAVPIIELVAGPDFVAAATALRWYIMAMVFLIAAAPVQRAMIALGRPGTLLLFEIATLAILAIALTIGAHGWGLAGVAAAIVFHKALQLVWSTWLVWRVIRERAQPAAPASSERPSAGHQSAVIPEERAHGT